METPKEYKKMLKEGAISKKALSEVLYSVNKRAKNHRDAKRRYKNSIYESNYDKSVEKEEEYYSMKDEILSFLKPIKIHKDVKVRDKYVKYYDYEPEYYSIKDYIREGEYYDRECDDYVKFKVVLEEEKTELLFLYYELEEYSYHTPINSADLSEYKDLQISELKDFKTYGADINDLLSIQFCKKVHEALLSGDLVIIE